MLIMVSSQIGFPSIVEEDLCANILWFFVCFIFAVRHYEVVYLIHEKHAEEVGSVNEKVQGNTYFYLSVSAHILTILFTSIFLLLIVTSLINQDQHKYATSQSPGSLSIKTKAWKSSHHISWKATLVAPKFTLVFNLLKNIEESVSTVTWMS